MFKLRQQVRIKGTVIRGEIVGGGVERLGDDMSKVDVGESAMFVVRLSDWAVGIKTVCAVIELDHIVIPAKHLEPIESCSEVDAELCIAAYKMLYPAVENHSVMPTDPAVIARIGALVAMQLHAIRHGKARNDAMTMNEDACEQFLSRACLGMSPDGKPDQKSSARDN